MTENGSGWQRRDGGIKAGTRMLAASWGRGPGPYLPRAGGAGWARGRKVEEVQRTRSADVQGILAKYEEAEEHTTVFFSRRLTSTIFLG